MKNLFVIVLMIASLGQSWAQQTLSFNESTGSPKATIEDVAWIAGYWRGEAMGGFTEEIWSRPFGGSMTASFKHVVNNKVNFYELETISEINGSLILKIKHFDATLVGWEEKDEYVEFKLVKLTDDTVYFDGLTFEKIADDEMNVWVVVDDDGNRQEVKFNYKRFRK